MFYAFLIIYTPFKMSEFSAFSRDATSGAFSQTFGLANDSGAAKLEYFGLKVG